MTTLDIAVIGCGVGGQAAATLLADAGHRVTVFERFAQPRPIGAGLLLQPTGLAVLRALDLDHEALSLGGRIDGIDGRTAGGRRVLDLHYRTVHRGAFGLGIHRGDLFQLLHGRLKRSTARLVTSTEIIAIWRLVSHCRAVIRLGSIDRAPIWNELSARVPCTREACPK